MKRIVKKENVLLWTCYEKWKICARVYNYVRENKKKEKSRKKENITAKTYKEIIRIKISRKATIMCRNLYHKKKKKSFD